MSAVTETKVNLGNIPVGIAVDAREKQRKGGLKAAPKINLKSMVGLGVIAKARAIMKAVFEQATAVKEWLLNLGTGFAMIKEIDQGVADDGPEFLDIVIDIEEEGPQGPVNVSRTTREIRHIFQVKIDAYLHWGDKEPMRALDALGEQELSEEDKQARLDPAVKKLIRRSAHTARWLFRLSEVKTSEEIRDLIAEFYHAGYLEPADDQEIAADQRRTQGGGKNHLIRGPEGKLYKLTNDDRFGRMGDDHQSTAEKVSTVEECFGRVTELSTRFRNSETRAAKLKEDELQEQSDMTMEDLWKGQRHGNGLCALSWFTRETRPQKRILQVRLDGNDSIWVVDGSEKVMDEIGIARDMKHRIPLGQLKDREGNLLYAHELPKMEPTGDRRLEGDDWDRFRNRRQVFYRFRELVHYAFECWITGEDQPRPQPEKPRPKKIERPKAKPVSPQTERVIQQDLGYVGTIATLEWIVESKLGDAILIVTGLDNAPELLAIRMKRYQRDGTTFISLCNAWHEAEQFFAGLKDKEFAELNRFEGVDEPLGKFLRRCWKQTKYPGQ